MPIGIDARFGERVSAGLSGPPGPPTARPPQLSRPTTPNPAPPPTAPPPGEPTTRIDTTPDIEVVVWTVWRTSGDERVCPVCGPLDGQEWPSGSGPEPPAHPNCRCARAVGRVEFRVRR